MDDKMIVELFWERSQTAIKETEKKYGKYCFSIARSVVSSREDAEECVNDAYLRTWESIPPSRPSSLKAYVGKIVRNLALDRYDASIAGKRFDSGVELALWELEDCIPSRESSVSDDYILRTAINGFLGSLPKRTRIIFMRRYWYFCSISEIAEGLGMSESNVKVTLLRTRNKFKEYLEKEGIGI